MSVGICCLCFVDAKTKRGENLVYGVECVCGVEAGGREGEGEEEMK
jgi:hypothetical protein